MSSVHAGLLVGCAGSAAFTWEPGGVAGQHCGHLRADAPGPVPASHAAVSCARPDGRCGAL